MLTGVFPPEGAFCPALFIRKSLEAEKPPHLRRLCGSEFSPATARDGLKAPELAATAVLMAATKSSPMV